MRSKEEKERDRIERWREWSRAVEAFSKEVSAKRGGKPIPVEEILEASREEADERLRRYLEGH